MASYQPHAAPSAGLSHHSPYAIGGPHGGYNNMGNSNHNSHMHMQYNRLDYMHAQQQQQQQHGHDHYVFNYVPRNGSSSGGGGGGVPNQNGTMPPATVARSRIPDAESSATVNSTQLPARASTPSATPAVPSQASAAGRRVGAPSNSAPVLPPPQQQQQLTEDRNRVDSSTQVKDNSTPGAPMKPLDVAHCFVYQYYYTLHDNPDMLHRFYDADSQVVRGGDRLAPSSYARASGQLEIHRAFEKCSFSNATCRIRVVEAQESVDGGLIVFVAGRLKNGDEAEREFVQTVFLSRQKPPRKGWYVFNEIFCYLDAAEVETDVPYTHVCSTDSQPIAAIDSSDGDSAALENDPVVQEQTWGGEQGLSSVVEEGTTENSKCYDGEAVTTPDAAEESHNGVSSVDSPLQERKIDSEVNAGTCENETEKMEEELPSAMEVRSNVARSEQSAKPTKQWMQKNETGDEVLNSKWPKPGENAPGVVDIENKPHAIVDVQHAVDMRHYAPTSYAGKLFKNISCTAPVKVGYVVPPKNELEANRTVEKVGNDVAVECDKGERVSGKRIWVSEIPTEMDDNAVKRAVAEQLSEYNGGHVIQIDRNHQKIHGYLELDCADSVNILLLRGLFFRGHKVRIDLVRPAMDYIYRRGGREHREKGGKRDGKGNRPYYSHEMDGRGGDTSDEKLDGTFDRKSKAGYMHANEEENRGDINRSYHHNKGGLTNDDMDGEGWIDASSKKSRSRGGFTGGEKEVGGDKFGRGSNLRGGRSGRPVARGLAGNGGQMNGRGGHYERERGNGDW